LVEFASVRAEGITGRRKRQILVHPVCIVRRDSLEPSRLSEAAGAQLPVSPGKLWMQLAQDFAARKKESHIKFAASTSKSCTSDPQKPNGSVVMQIVLDEERGC